MLFKFLCAILGVFLLTGNAYAQDKSLRLRQAPEVVNTYCAIAEKLNEAQKDETKIFMGFIDQSNVLQVSTGENGFWNITIENASGITCVYFMGQMGTILIGKEPKKDADLQRIIRREVNGVNIHK
tara:strand:- start:15 stop:392 length:378 start_codon:yes stop_codon:yes gene_type:complete